MISRDDVISAYRIILRRSPESESVIDHWMSRCEFPEQLISSILGSTEFRLSVYRRALPESEPRLSAREIAERFGVYPESNLVRWLRDYPTIEGMVLPSAAYMSAALAQLQARQNLSGNIAEIGVYHGKHLAGLATSLKNGEKAIAVDVFEDQALNEDAKGYQELGSATVVRALTQDAFEHTMATYCPDACLMTIKRSSLELTPADLMPNDEKVRFFSIDGGHTLEILLNDLRLAEATLAPHGLISIDDILNEDWPGIITGVVRHFDAGTRLRPVAFIANKLLCAFEPFADFYRKALLNIAPLSIQRRNVEFSNYTADQYIDGDDIFAFLRALPL